YPTRRNLAALRRSPRAELTAAGADSEVGRRGFCVECLHHTFDAYLSLDRVPVEEQRRVPVIRQLSRLATLAVCKEREAVFVDALEEHNSGGWFARWRCRGERHRVGLKNV